MRFGLALTPFGLAGDIEDAIAASTPAFEALVAGSVEIGAPTSAPLPLAIKYIPTRYASMYRGPNNGLRISTTEGFTWGTGTYVAPVTDPLSTALYGRAGVVARFDPRGWRVFDARDPANELLYQRWLGCQPTTSSALLTVHSHYFLHRLRNFFRERFLVDCVLFRPDERDRLSRYTSPANTWMAVSDWTGVHLAEGDSARFLDARLAVVVEEEFLADIPALTLSPLLNLSGTGPSTAGLADRIKRAYPAGRVERVES